MLTGSASALWGQQAPQKGADAPFIVVASTTSTENSGLFTYLLPRFTERSGIEVRVVAQGTGQALRTARNGDADVLFVHHRPSEEKFVADGEGLKRLDVMFNDFVLVGPEDDPAGVGGLRDAPEALKRIAAKGAVFASRGDDSGTHKAERGLWDVAGLAPWTANKSWYRELGSGMGATLNTAAAMGAYTLADRATWVAFSNKGALRLLVEGDTRLFNPYGVIVVNPAKHPHTKAELGTVFATWLVSKEGQEAIAGFRVQGQQLFFPNAQAGQ